MRLCLNYPYFTYSRNSLLFTEYLPYLISTRSRTLEQPKLLGILNTVGTPLESLLASATLLALTIYGLIL